MLMDAVAYINKTYTMISDISPKNYAKLARNNIDGKLYVLKFLKAYDVNVYKTLQQIAPEGVSKIFEVLESPKGLYVVEEYVDGCTLDKFFERASVDSKRAEQMLTDIISKVLEALKCLHSVTPPIIHRDIKPENIMVSVDGKVKLIDFNISRGYTGNAGRDTVAMGTSDFAAPEQYGFYESDPRTDIYGVGATTSFMLKKLGLNAPHLLSFVERAMAFSPKDRFNSAAEAQYYLLNYYKIVEENLRKQKEEENANSWRRFLPPGFRRGNAAHIIIACFGYMGMIIHTISSIVGVKRYGTYRPAQYTLALILVWAWFILITFFSFDYLGVQKLFKIDKLQGSSKVLAIIGVDILIIIITVMIGAFFVNKV